MTVTVYITTKNRLLLLERAVQSVLRQSHSDIDLIVVDDGSEDDTPSYLRKMEDAGLLRSIINRQSYGACYSRNAAIESSRGTFITGLDDDDFFLPKRIEFFLRAWRNNAVSNTDPVAGLFDTIILDEGGVERKLHTSEKVVRLRDLKESNCIGNQIFAPKDHFVGAGLFDPQVPAWQDWDMWVRMAQRFGRFVNIQMGSYVVSPDMQYSAGATRNRPEFVIRYAGQLFQHKYMTNSLSDRCAIIENLLNYPQVIPSVHEISILLRAGRRRAATQAALKRARATFSLPSF